MENMNSFVNICIGYSLYMPSAVCNNLSYHITQQIKICKCYVRGTDQQFRDKFDQS